MQSSVAKSTRLRGKGSVWTADVQPLGTQVTPVILQHRTVLGTRAVSPGAMAGCTATRFRSTPLTSSSESESSLLDEVSASLEDSSPGIWTEVWQNPWGKLASADMRNATAASTCAHRMVAPSGISRQRSQYCCTRYWKEDVPTPWWTHGSTPAHVASPSGRHGLPTFLARLLGHFGPVLLVGHNPHHFGSPSSGIRRLWCPGDWILELGNVAGEVDHVAGA